MQVRSIQQGLTLIELLVTMVLLGFVVALMSGAFVQIGQMLRISSEHGNGFSSRWTQSRALQDIVSNMVADPTQDIPIIGTPLQVTLTTLALPPKANGIGQRASLALIVSNSAGAESTTVLQVQNASSVPPSFTEKPFELARYNGRLVFFYLDNQGQEHSQWPVLGTTQTSRLPIAIGIRDESQNNSLLQIAHYEGTQIAKQNDGLGGMFGAQR